MSLKEQIKKFHNDFHLLLVDRDNFSSTDQSKILEFDQKLLDMIKRGLNKNIPFSKEMDDWVPASESLIETMKNNKDINSLNGLVTVQEALAIKLEKEEKFKKVQTLSMLVCTFLLILYYALVTWIL